jgi:hypothetical protein
MAAGHFPAAQKRQMSPAQALRTLQAEQDFVAGAIPEERRPLITRVNHDIRDLIVATLKEVKAPGRNPVAIRAAILRRFKRAGLKQVKDDYAAMPVFSGMR